MRPISWSVLLIITCLNSFAQGISSAKHYSTASLQSLHSTNAHFKAFDAADTIKYSGSTTFCDGGSLLLTANNALPGSTFQWLNNNNIISGATNVSYTATAPGSYTVTVTRGDTATTYPPLVITVNPKPSPDFSFENNNCSGTALQFTSNISSGIAPFTYSWDFGDGTNSNAQNPTHTYNSLGCSTATFTISLIVTDANGCSNSIT